MKTLQLGIKHWSNPRKFCVVKKVVYFCFIIGQLKMNGNGVYLQFACSLQQASVALHPCTKFTIKNSSWKLHAFPR